MSGTDVALIEPLVPSGTDLRSLPYMPLEVNRLVDSDLVALATGDEFKAAVVLWAKSWMQVPAASLPSEDRILARLAGLSMSEWKQVREMALHGWVKCSDGRLYHPVIADQAVRVAAKSTSQSARAKSRWAKVKNQENSTNGAMPRHQSGISVGSTPLMQVEGEVEVEEKNPPKGPQKSADLFTLDRSTGSPVEGFENGWKAYPQKGRSRSSKAAAQQLWRQASKQAGGPDRLTAAISRYAASDDARREGGMYVPALERWLKAQKFSTWLDEPPEGPRQEVDWC